MNNADRRKTLKKKMSSDREIIVLPGAYDCVSAKLIEKAGFDALYIGSYATSASMFGLPDGNLLDRAELVDHAKRVNGAVNVPVIADAENGFGNVVQVRRTVRAFEEAGLAGIHIEDQEGGKHMEGEVSPRILEASAMVKKIEAAVDAREDENFLIIGRTDIPWATGDLEEAVHRGEVYLKAGADLAFLAGLRPGHLPLLKERLFGKLCIVNTGAYAVSELQRHGVKAVIYYSAPLFAAYRAVEQILKNLKEKGTIEDALPLMADYREFEDFIGFPEIIAELRRFAAT